jgi:cobalt-zinc-cadmium efflux system outer membrane protein
LVASTVRELLGEELTVDRAVRIALLNNRALQATLQDLGIARAEAIQVSLIQNPVFSGHARVPEDSGKTNLELALTQSVLDALYAPLRARVAKAQFEQVKLQVAHEVLRLLTEVKRAYYTAQAAEQTRAMQQTALQAAEAAAELAKRQYEAGNVRDFDLANEQAAYQQAQVDLTHSEIALTQAREALNQLLGLSGADAAGWVVATHLPDLPPSDPSLGQFEDTAISQRLDVAAARKEAEAIRRTLTLARVGIIPWADVGANTETEPDGDRVTGPMWDLAVPLFDWGQANRARAKAQLRRSEHRLAALEVAVRAEVRTLHTRLVAERQMAQRYREQLIPLREQITASSQRHFNYMLIGAFQLLQFKQQEITARREYIEAVRDYWIARADLEQAVGGQLSPAAFSIQPTTPPTGYPAPSTQEVPEATHQHEHGGQP